MYNIKISQNSIKQPQNNQLNINSRKHTSFEQLFQQQINNTKEIKFSKHAMDRLEQRNISLTDRDISRLNKAIDTAAQKGVKETLILMDNRVFIASVKNKTVITAADGEHLKENVFTNIDGAVII